MAGKVKQFPKMTPGLWARGIVGILFLVLFVLALVWANSGFNGYTITETSGIEYETAKVIDVLANNTVEDETTEGLLRGSMLLELELLTGRYAGDIVEVTNYLSPMYQIMVGEGDTISVRVDTSGKGEYQVSVYNYNRIPWVIGIVAVFLLALVLIGGWQGVRAFAGLAFTFVCIVFLLLPLTLKGWNVIALTIAIVGVTSAVSFYLLGGWQPKMVGAALGCLCGVAFAALLGWIASQGIHISAYQMDEAEALMLVTSDEGIKLKLKGLFLAGILIASEGAVMDIAMSVASAMDELKQKRPDISGKELFRSGMRIGKDATGTMANTLVLAFAGSSFNMMLLIYSYDVSFIQLVNTDFVAVELIRGVVGSLGIILTVPCTAAATALLLNSKKK